MRTRRSFGVAIDLDTVEMLKETDPDTFWQTPHYEGWPAVLIRYDSADPERVRAMIERSRDWTAPSPSRGRGRRSDAEFRALRRDRLVGRQGEEAQGHRHRDLRGRRRGAERWSGPAMSGRAPRCWTGCSTTAAEAPTLFGFDFSFAPPIAERGEYLPGEPDVPSTRTRVLGLCRPPLRRRGSRRRELPRAGPPPPFLFRHRRRREGATSCISALRARLNATGRRQDRERLRRDRRRPGRQGELRRACGCFTGSTAGSPIWPMDPLPEQGSAVVEIYTRIYLRRAGLSGTQAADRGPSSIARSKALGSRAGAAALRAERPPDRRLVTAAGMRALARPSRAPSPRRA